jgi:AraC-like DNA-binding protein
VFLDHFAVDGVVTQPDTPRVKDWKLPEVNLNFRENDEVNPIGMIHLGAVSSSKTNPTAYPRVVTRADLMSTRRTPDFERAEQLYKSNIFGASKRSNKLRSFRKYVGSFPDPDEVLTPTQKKVLVFCEAASWDRFGMTKRSNETIASFLNISISTVKRALKVLESLDFITTVLDRRQDYKDIQAQRGSNKPFFTIRILIAHRVVEMQKGVWVANAFRGHDLRPEVNITRQYMPIDRLFDGHIYVKESRADWAEVEEVIRPDFIHNTDLDAMGGNRYPRDAYYLHEEMAFFRDNPYTADPKTIERATLLLGKRWNLNRRKFLA